MLIYLDNIFAISKKIVLYKIRYYFIMKFSLDSFLCWLLIRSAETYYGDSLKNVVLTNKSND